MNIKDLMIAIAGFCKSQKENRKLAHKLACDCLRAAVDNHCEPLNAIQKAFHGAQLGEFRNWVEAHGKAKFDAKTGRFYLPKGSKKEWKLDEAAKRPFWVAAEPADKPAAQKKPVDDRLRTYLEKAKTEGANNYAVKLALLVLDGHEPMAEAAKERDAALKAAAEARERAAKLQNELLALKGQQTESIDSIKARLDAAEAARAERDQARAERDQARDTVAALREELAALRAVVEAAPAKPARRKRAA